MEFVQNHALSVLSLSAVALAQAPPNYYQSVDATSAATLRATLHEIIDDHQRFPYTSTATDTWNILELADENPTNSSKILDVYRNGSYNKAGGGNNKYNREHTWPKSYGFPNDGSSNYAYTDCHHLFLCNSSYNSSRSNNPFQTGDASWTEKTTFSNAGQGGGSGTYPGNSNWRSSEFWQVWGSRKGDVARALLYLDVRYEGGTHGVTGHAEPDLVLTDDLNLVAASNTGSNIGLAYMGLLDTLLQWHADDPVDVKEADRNDAVYFHQGNRNPFIDHPEWVTMVFGSGSGGGGGGGGTGGGGGGGGTGPTGGAWINELHYDNKGGDRNEFVEVAGPAGLDLSGWTLVGYNGNGGEAYKTVTLEGVIPNQEGGVGAVAFDFSGLQNGSPDGVALISDAGEVIQFLSYEGAFTATNGPAAGVASVDIGQSETSNTRRGHSLQLGGAGSSYADFTWQSPRNDTPGQLNENQSIQ